MYILKKVHYFYLLISILILVLFVLAPVSDQEEENSKKKNCKNSVINISVNDKSEIIQASASVQGSSELTGSESVNTIDTESMFFQTSDIDHFICLTGNQMSLEKYHPREIDFDLKKQISKFVIL